MKPPPSSDFEEDFLMLMLVLAVASAPLTGFIGRVAQGLV